MPRIAANRPKNFTRFSRTMTGGESGSLAPVMSCGLVLFTGSESLAGHTRRCSRQRCFLRIAFGGRRSARLARLLGSILRGALGLDVGGAENAVASELAFRQGLRVVFESVGRSFRAGVNHRQ